MLVIMPGKRHKLVQQVTLNVSLAVIGLLTNQCDDLLCLKFRVGLN